MTSHRHAQERSDILKIMYASRTGGLRALSCIAVAMCAVMAGGGSASAAPRPIAAETTYMGAVRGANWFSSYIPTDDGTRLYADVLLPRKRKGRIPAVVVIGPYFQHLRTSSNGLPVEAPPKRYDDLLDGAGLLERGYAVVFADLRGFGASGGCPDNSGGADRSDIRRVVRWAATQHWSAGKVGMYGKSYDGVSGLVAAGQRIPGLAAVVAQEPVYDWYRYLYGNGVPRTTRIGTPLSLVYTSGNPPPANLSNRQFRGYIERSAANLISPACLPTALGGQQSARPDDPYWPGRAILRPLRGSTVPVFLSQGFIDQNTAADGLTELLHDLNGPVTGWLGMWDHVRGNDTDRTALMGRLSERSSTGRTDYFSQVARFYDYYLKGRGTAPTGFYVQDNTASWRVQAKWPTQSSVRRIPLRAGTYRYDAKQVATKIWVRGRWVATQIDGVAAAADMGQWTADDPANGVWTILAPESTDVRISGAPQVMLTATARHHDPNPFLQQTPVAVDLYDVSPSGHATLITQNVSMLNPKGTWLRLYATDWVLRAGHRLAVRVTDSNRGRWDYPTPTNNAIVTVAAGVVRLPLASVNIGTPTSGTSNTSLEGYLRRYRYPVPGR